LTSTVTFSDESGTNDHTITIKGGIITTWSIVPGGGGGGGGG